MQALFWNLLRISKPYQHDVFMLLSPATVQNLRNLSHKGVAHRKLTKGAWRLVSIENVRNRGIDAVAQSMTLITFVIRAILERHYTQRGDVDMLRI